MPLATPTALNVKQAVPFFSIASMETSLHYYIEGLGFTLTNKWTREGKIRCAGLN